MAFFGKLSSDSSMAALTKSTALQVRRATTNSCNLPILGAALPGTGFETLPPFAILFKPFQFLKCLGLNSVGLGLDCVPFHSGWELVKWKLAFSVLESNYSEILEICEEIEVEEELEVFEPQIELSLTNPTDMGNPSVEVAEVAPTVVVEVEEESSVEILESRASVEKMMGDQAEGTGNEPVLESAEKELENQAVGVGHNSAHKTVEERTGTKPVLMDVEEARTGDEPVLESEELRTGKEPVPADVEMGTGDIPVREIEAGDSHYEDFQDDDFEKVGEFMLEETPQTPADPAHEIFSEQIPFSAEPRKKRIKTPAGGRIFHGSGSS